MPDSGRKLNGYSSLRIGAFPSGPELWRVDWFGSIAFPNRMVRRSQPSVLVHLSRIVDTGVVDDPNLLLSTSSTLPVERQIKRWVSVGTLAILGIGDIWSDRLLIASPNYELQTFNQVRVDETTISPVKAGERHDNGNFLLPFAEHPWHATNTRSWCVQVQMPDRRVLVIPCMELIRFYFGSSSALLSRLFKPPLAKDQLFTDCRLTVSRIMKLGLASGIPRASASDVARIAGDPVAWRAAVSVGTSCLRASVVDDSIYPQMGFPFEGVSDLTATGRWLPGPTGRKHAFLVYQLRSCSHPFPFRALNYRHHPDERRAARFSETNEGGAAESSPPRGTRSSRASETTLVEQDASSSLTVHEAKIFRRRVFTDLERKMLWRSQSLSNGTTAIKSEIASPVESISVDIPGSSARVRPVTLVDALNRSRDLAPAFLLPVLAALEGLTGCDIVVATASDENGWTVPMDVEADEDGVLGNEWFVADGSRHRLRQVAVFLLCIAQRANYLVVVEGDFFIPLFYSADGCTSEQVAVEHARRDYPIRIGQIRGKRATMLRDTLVAADTIYRWLRRRLFHSRSREAHRS